MDRKSRLVLFSCFLAVALICIIIINFPFGENNNSSNYDDPPYQGDAVWTSEDKKSRFKVEDQQNYCFGELYFEGKTLPVCYEFKGQDIISVYSNEDGQLTIENHQLIVPEGTETFYGSCKSAKNKTVLEIYRLGNSEHTEKITFEKKGSDSIFK